MNPYAKLIFRRFAGVSVSAVMMVAAGSAWAHAHLKSAIPMPNATLTTAPSALELSFTENLEMAFSGVDVSGPDGKTVPIGKLALQGGNGSQIVVPLKATLTQGAYTVTWHALSVDGHKTHGTYRFFVK